MLSTDLAHLYQVAPRALVQAVKRNLDRFPDDFMFQLSSDEFQDLKSQIVTSSWGGLRRATPYAFTEEGVANSWCDLAREHRDPFVYSTGSGRTPSPNDGLATTRN
jgi:hypothetical protein